MPSEAAAKKLLTHLGRHLATVQKAACHGVSGPPLSLPVPLLREPMSMPVAAATNACERAEGRLAVGLLGGHVAAIGALKKTSCKRTVARLAASLGFLRRALTPAALRAFLVAPRGTLPRGGLLARVAALLDSATAAPLAAMDGDGALHGGEAVLGTLRGALADSPVVAAYLGLVGAALLLEGGHVAASEEALLATVAALEELNDRSLDALLARAYYLVSRIYDIVGHAATSPLHGVLMAGFRRSALVHDTEAHGVIYNALLRSFIFSGHIEAAASLIATSPYPLGGTTTPAKDGAAAAAAPPSGKTLPAVSGSNQARFHYYNAMVLAIQADYGGAKGHAIEAIRKAPTARGAVGFVQAATKLLVTVELLRGDVPDRALFSQVRLAKCLAPYLVVAQAVRLGDLPRFQRALAAFGDVFAADRTVVLVRRLHHNVLKAGLRRLAAAYTRIPLADVQRKLSLSSLADAEFVLLKAISDGAVDGEIVQEGAYLQTRAKKNAFYTTAPQLALNDRIGQLNALHNDCLRAMTFPLAGGPAGGATSGAKGGAGEDDEAFEAPPTDAELIEEYMGDDEDGMDM